MAGVPATIQKEVGPMSEPSITDLYHEKFMSLYPKNIRDLLKRAGVFITGIIPASRIPYLESIKRAYQQNFALQVCELTEFIWQEQAPLPVDYALLSLREIIPCEPSAI